VEKTIFIQIAAYRDSELIPTVKDCIANASNPARLHFCIGWQHAEDENIDELKSLPNTKIIEVPYTETKGTCWMRRVIQDQYNGEDYTLQLDSHHRFTKNWDTELIKMLEGLRGNGVDKPLLTAYLSSYDPKNDPAARILEPWQINYDRFLPEGPIFLRPSSIHLYQALKSPLPARGLSAHFIFTDGKFCNEVKYDSELYFHGEEISLAVRSFTWGYDLFHPNKVLMWHQYTREGAKKHWDDHTNWGTLNSLSYKRVKILLGIDGEDSTQVDFKECGLGTTRTIYDYERYAGVEFKSRRMLATTIKEVLLPVYYANEGEFQSSLVSAFKYCIDIHRPSLVENDYDFWCIVFKDKDNKDLFRKDADANEIKTIIETLPNDKFVHIWRDFQTDKKPFKWTVWPHSKSKEWNTGVIEGVIQY